MSEVLIRAYAAAINPVDWKRRIGAGEFKTIKPGGYFVSVATRNIEAKCSAAGVRYPARFNAFEVGRPIFEEVGKLADSGKLSVHIDKSFPLARAGDAQVYSEQGRTQGKISLVVDAAHANEK